MQWSQRPPCPALAPYVRLLWHWEGYSQPHAEERVVPDGCASLIIHLQPSAHAQLPLLVGARSEYMVIETAQQSAVMGIQFKPGGAFPFLGMPGNQLHNEVVTLDNLWGPLATELRDRLFAASGAEARFVIAENALLRVARHLGRHPMIDHALRRLADERPGVASISDEIGVSARHFNQVFKQHVGMSPKTFWRVQRFQSVLDELQGAAAPDWADVAVRSGYYDQAHFIHDLKAFCGLTPSKLVAHQTEHRNHLRH